MHSELERDQEFNRLQRVQLRGTEDVGFAVIFIIKNVEQIPTKQR